MGCVSSDLGFAPNGRGDLPYIGRGLLGLDGLGLEGFLGGLLG